MSSSARSPDRSLLVIAGGVVTAVHVAKLAPSLPALREALGISLVQAGFLVSMVQFAAIVLGLVVGLASDRLGLRRVMLAGLVLVSLAGVAGGFVSDARLLLVLRAMEGLGFLMAVTPAPSLIRREVPPQRLQARLGLWGAYMPLGTAMALLLGPSWIAALGWQSWWWLTALPSAAVALALWLRLPADPVRRADAAPLRLGAMLRETLSSPGPWLVSVAFCVYAMQWLSVMSFLPSIYTQAGLSPVLTGVATAIAAGANIIGNVSSGRLLQRGIAPQRLLQTGYITMGCASVLMFAPLWPAGTWSAIGPFLAVVVFSAVGGLIPGTLFSQAVRLAPSPSTVSTTVGWMQQWSSVGQFSGPPIVAAVAARVGDWSLSWMVLVTCGCIGLVLAHRIGRLSAAVSARIS